MSRRAALAASFVVTVSGGCDSVRGGGSHRSPPSLFRSGDECRYMEGSSCPEGASCNPPPPRAAECPAGMGDDGDLPKTGKVRILEHASAYQGSCTFAADYLCAMPPAAGCDQQPQVKLTCRQLAPKAGGTSVHHVEGFVAKRADGRCSRYPAFTCVGGCELPEAETVPCESPAPEPSFPVEGEAPTPYTAAQIREATLPGRRYVWQVKEGSTTSKRVLEFTVVDEEGATMVSARDEASLGQSSPGRATWEELKGHASFPAAHTSVERETIEVPAGAFACRVYTVKDADGTLRRFYFADELPGAPVLSYVERKGKRVSTTTLLEHVHGEAEASAP